MPRLKNIDELQQKQSKNKMLSAFACMELVELARLHAVEDVSQAGQALIVTFHNMLQRLQSTRIERRITQETGSTGLCKSKNRDVLEPSTKRQCSTKT